MPMLAASNVTNYLFDKVKGFGEKALVITDYGTMMAHCDFYMGHQKIGGEFIQGLGCLSGDAVVHTPNGLENIKDIRPGTEIFDGEGDIRIVSEHFEYDYKEDFIEISSFYGGKPIRITGNHMVLVARNIPESNVRKINHGHRFAGKEEVCWVQAKDIRKGDLVVMPKVKFELKNTQFVICDNIYKPKRRSGGVRDLARKIGVAPSAIYSYVVKKGSGKEARKKIEEYLEHVFVDLDEVLEATVVKEIPPVFEMNYDFGKIFGLWISDGWLVKGNSAKIGFCCKKSEDNGEILGFIRRVFNLEPYIYEQKNKDVRTFVVSHFGLACGFRKLFSDYQYTSGTKYIPKFLLETPEEFRLGLLHGLWSGDGSFKGKTTYTTVSQKLANGVFSLLISLGFHAGIKGINREEKRKSFRKTQFWTQYTVMSAPYFENITARNGYFFDGQYVYYRIRSIEKIKSDGKAYGFTVQDNNSYLAGGFVVRNPAAGCFVE